MKMMKTALIIALAACMMLGMTACGGQPTATSDAPENTTPATTAPEDTSAPETDIPEETEDAHYPVEITNYNYIGDEITVTYEKAPERVIAVYQGCVETMIALGLEDHVVAAYGLDNEVKDEWKAGLEKANYDSSVFAPDKETVSMLEPDMIFSWSSYFGEEKLGDVSYWMESGTNAFISSNTRRGGHARTLENEYADILNIGKIFNVEDKAEAIVNEIKDEIATALEQTKGQEKQSVVILEFLTSITNYGATSLGADMVTQLGGEMLIPELPQIGNEDLLEADPDVIFVVYMEKGGENVREECVEKVMNDPTLASLKAVQNSRVYPIMLGDMFASAVRSIDGIRSFAAGLYPELG